jgi:acyl carrier protein
MRSIQSIARTILALHVGRRGREIRAWHRLGADLDLTPLELVLVTLEIEQRAQVELPTERLEAVETVGDLFAFLAQALAGRDRDRALDRVA